MFRFIYINTTFIDLRAYNNDTIDSMGDLLDYELESLRLRVLVNGGLSSDTFRHAYVVVVENATKWDDAEQPDLTASASVTGVALSEETGFTNSSDYKVERSGNTVTATKTVKVELAAGTKVTLAVNLNNASKCTGLSSITWSGLGTMSNTTGNATTVEVPATGSAFYTATVTNTDTARTDGKYMVTKVVFEVSAKNDGGSTEPEQPTKTLTLAGDLLVDPGTGNANVGKPNATVNVYVATDGKTSSNVAMKMLPGGEVATATYQIPAGSKVTISSGAFTASGATIPVKADDGTTVVNVALNNNSGTDTITFTMPDANLTLNMSTADQFVNADGSDNTTQVYTLKSSGGVTGTFKDGTTNEEKTLSADGEITIEHAGTFTVGETGTGNAVITARTETTLGNAAVKGGTIAITAANTTLYSASKVTPAGTGVTLSGANSISVSANTATYVEAGVALTIVKGSFDGVLVGETDAKSGDAAALTLTLGDKDVYVSGAWKVELSSNITAQDGDGNALSSGKLVKNATGLTLAPSDTTNMVAVELTTGTETVAAGIDNAVASVTAAKKYDAFTKVVLSIDNAAKVSLASPYGRPMNPEIAQSASANVGVKSGTSIYVTGKVDAANDIIKFGTKEGTGEDATLEINVTESIPAASASAAPTGIVVVGSKTFTLTQGQPS